MKNRQDNKNQGTEERHTLKDFDLRKPEVIRESMQVVPK